MKDDKEKAIRRLKKLMALTGSSNANEASAALARAQKLADAHGITQDDIEILDINESICDYWPVGASNPPGYMAGLLQVIKDAFGVDCILLGGCGVSFYGLYNRPVTRNARESGKTRDNDNARNSGYLEGRQASLHHPVNGQEQAKLGVNS
ncbi:DUF2786 domain-containing protein [Salmonella enterica]|nr:DUF2786 domain-containing protein [Salmonella enterica]